MPDNRISSGAGVTPGGAPSAGRWALIWAAIPLALFLLFGVTGLFLIGQPQTTRSEVWAVVGAWLLIAGASGLATLLVWGLAKRVIGIESHIGYGFRTSALVISILVAGAVSPPAIQDMIRVGEVIMRLALVTTPQIMVDAGAKPVPAAPSATTPPASVPPGVNPAATTDANAAATAPTTTPTTTAATVIAGRPAAMLLRCISGNWPFRQERSHWRSTAASTTAAVAAAAAQPTDAYCPAAPGAWQSSAQDWFVFVLVMMLCLILSRSLYGAYNKQYGGHGDAAHAGRVGGAITYGQWLALLIYSAIILPSGYLAIGSMVLLQTEPGATTAPTARPASPAPDEALVVAMLKTKDAGEPVASFRSAIAYAADSVDLKYVKYASGAIATLAPGRLDVRLTELQAVRTVSRDSLASTLRACADSQAGGKPAAPVAGAAPALSPMAAPTTAATPSAAIPATAPPAPAAARSSPAPGPSVSDPCAGAAAADPSTDEDWEAPAYPPLNLVDRVYPWLQEDRGSRPILMIMGLVGFGLLGAAIRTMGKPEDNLVVDRQAAVQVGGQARTAPKLNPTEFGKIIVQGVGAAMVVFLAFQAGSLVFSGQAANSPFPQLLFSFLGAVFAQEVWEWGAGALAKALNRASGGLDNAEPVKALQERLDAAQQLARKAVAAGREHVANLGDDTARAAAHHALVADQAGIDETVKAARASLSGLGDLWSRIRKDPTSVSDAEWRSALGAADAAVGDAEAAARRLHDAALGPASPGAPHAPGASH